MKRAVLIAGCALLVVIWAGPLPQLARQAFYAHMIMHMGVVAVAAPLIAIGVAGTRMDPAARWPRLFSPVPASLVELVVVWAWHMPSLHHVARHSASGVVVEQATFLAAGLLLWIAALGGGRTASANRTGAGVVALLLTSMHMTLLGALLALASRPLYAHASGDAPLSAIADQHLGGAIMLLVGGASYVLGGIALTARLLNNHRRAAAEGA